MRAFQALVIVAVLSGAATLAAGVTAMRPVLGIVLPYLALAVFLAGMVARVVWWARSPVPFKITTVCGQQRSLPFLRRQPLESPFTGWQVVGRMALEILLFRSLFRNTRTELTPRKNLAYQPDKLLWAGALAFHWSFLVIILRHLRLFLEPVPRMVGILESVDGFFQLAVPTFLLTDAVIVAALLYLLARRLFNARVRYVSLAADYLALFLLLGIAGTGIAMRYFWKVDLVSVKELALGLVTLRPVLPEGVGAIFFVHLFLVSVLFAYFPFSKLVHMGGVFLSPTRNMANDNRARRHVNPWNHPVPVHTYEEWEEEFHDKLVACGLPLDKE
ncbi:MAG: menaquinol oxidoreductase [Acidobacteria bacterium]|nr:menaquinol oxidoreductase [Acidobacteriota bacterium]